MAIRVCDPAQGWWGLREALTAARRGDTVRVPAGEYAGEGTLELPAGVALEGARGACLCSTGLGPVLSIGAGGCRVSGLRFLPAGHDGQVFVHIRGTEGVLVSRCRFDGGGRAGAAVLVEDAREVDVSKCLAVRCGGVGSDDNAIEFRRSQGRVLGNRCGKGGNDGIAIASSAVEVQDNKCWGNGRSGIVVARDPLCPSRPSKVSVKGNRCHGNEGDGITFSSSVGEAWGNESWGNGANGIAVQRDKVSPRRPSKVSVKGNRCHGNKGGGIAFVSSVGVARGNECWGNGFFGILVKRDEEFTDQPLKATVEGNRCHGNKHSGVAFGSIEGEARGNECWGNETEGILFVSSQGLAVNNRCHVNWLCGISFLYVEGQARGNECWGNKEAGILFDGSRGLAENNDCWLSKTRSGICVQSGSTGVLLRGNRCHDNKHSGIAFSSSEGEARGNQCWGNGLHGIDVQRNQESPGRPSKVTLEGNRCYGNTEVGIVFSSSAGEARGNTCWGNGLGSGVHREGPSAVLVEDHRQDPDLAADIAGRTRQRAAHPLQAWLSACAGNEARARALADCVYSGGCADCFARFWSGGVSALAVGESERRSGSRPAQGRGSDGLLVLTYDVVVEQKGPTHETHIVRKAPSGLQTIGRALSSQWQDFSRRAGNAAARRRPWKLLKAWWKGDNRLRAASAAPKWTVALVSTDEEAFRQWVNLGQGDKADWKSRRLVLGPSAVARRSGERGFLEHELLGQHAGHGWRLWLARVEALLLAPAGPASARFLLFAVVLGLLVAWLIEVPGAIIHQPDLLISHWRTQTANAWWAKLALFYGVLVPLVFAMLVWNPLLPRCLKLSHRFLLDVVDLPGAGLVKTLFEEKAWLRHSEPGRRFWLRRKLYGYRLFGGLFRAPLPAVVAVERIDEPGSDDTDDLRAILAVAPRNQPVFLVTRMPGLSMLVDGYLDVWFTSLPDEGVAYPGRMVHDSASIALRPADEDQGGMKAEAQLERLLGLSAPEQAQALAVPDKWVLHEMLPALVLGSTPHMHVQVRRWPGEFDQNEEFLAKELAFFLRVPPLLEANHLGLDKSGVDNLNEFTKRGVALLNAKDSEEGTQWIGQVGHRLQVVGVLRALYREYAGKKKQMRPDRPPIEPHNAETYLSELLTCGELYHLAKAQALLEARDDDLKAAQRVPLHLEAALFLLEDQRTLNSQPAKLRETVAEEWEKLAGAVLRSNKVLLERSEAWGERVCLPVLLAMQRLGGRPALAKSLQKAIEQPWFGEARDGEPDSLWRRFLCGVSRYLGTTLARLDEAEAGKWLDARLAQDWHLLPDAHKTLLREQLPSLGWRYASHLARHVDSAAALKRGIASLRLRPALAVLLFVHLGAAEARSRARAGGEGEASKEAMADLELVAQTAFRLGGSAGYRGLIHLEPGPMPVFSPGPQALAAALDLARDKGLLRELCADLVAAEEEAQRMEAASAQLAGEIEGVALGRHSGQRSLEEYALIAAAPSEGGAG